MKLIRRNGLLLAIISMSLVPSLRATVIYNNSSNDLLARFSPGTTEVGDEILLGSTERYLTNFSFEYYGTNTASPGNLSFAGSVQARIRFYRNDGATFNGYPTPGTVMYDSDWFGGFGPTSRSTLNFTAGTDFPINGLFLDVSSNMTWSVQFRNLGATDEVGVDLYSPPTVGGSYPDYWDNGAGWQLKTNALPMDFAAKMDATVPEPSVLAMSSFGGLGVLFLARYIRRKR
jgi:hypothetical protein